MCSIFKVSRSGYYAWLIRKPSKHALENKMLIKEIKKIYKESRQTYGSPRITEELRSRNILVSRPRVARLMKQEKIRSRTKKKYVITTDSKHSFSIAPNLVDRTFIVQAPGKVWVSDITYVRTTQGWLYLTIVLDLFDRKVIGWSLSTLLDTLHTTIPALSMALRNRMKDPELIFHSDRGVQYASDAFKQILSKESIRQSMSRKGNCWDNAVAESFFKSIKVECINQCQSKSIREMKKEIFWYIEVWYNRIRKHSTLNYATPEEMEILYYKLLAA
jgi:transposase InsO family protein